MLHTCNAFSIKDSRVFSRRQIETLIETLHPETPRTSGRWHRAAAVPHQCLTLRRLNPGKPTLKARHRAANFMCLKVAKFDRELPWKKSDFKYLPLWLPIWKPSDITRGCGVHRVCWTHGPRSWRKGNQMSTSRMIDNDAIGLLPARSSALVGIAGIPAARKTGNLIGSQNGYLRLPKPIGCLKCFQITRLEVCWKV